MTDAGTETSATCENEAGVQGVWRRFAVQRIPLASAIFMTFFVVLVGLWPWIQPHSPQVLGDLQFEPPGPRYWAGTGVHGRDLFSRMMHGAGLSLMVGASGALVSLVIGVSWGSVAGYAGGRVDAVMMRVVDVLYSLPSIIFVVVLITTLESLLKQWFSKSFSPELASSTRFMLLLFGLGSVSWLTMARIVRGQVLSLKNRAFVSASRALGASHAHILWRHILPNLWGVVIVYLTLTVPSVVLYESFLSFLGLGVQPPQASLGSLIAEGASQINSIRVYWWLIVLPSALLATLLLALSFVGDGLRDSLETRDRS